MREKQAEFEPEIERALAAIDADSAVSTSTQLRGALEFGIASGDLTPGRRLPSVRILARRLGLSPVTVSNVYAALQAAGHIEGRAGSGTYVSATAEGGRRHHLAEVDRRIAELLDLGRSCGLSPSDLALRVSMSQSSSARPVSLLLVGNFHDATEAYAEDLRAHLRDGDAVTAMTLSDLRARGTAGHDLIAAPRTLLHDIREAAPDVDAVGVTFIPNEATRVALASLRPESRVAGYSYFPGFVATMKTGIQRFAPHIAPPTMIVRGEGDEAARIAEAEVVIYASGADYLTGSLRREQAAFEYRHAPDAQSIRDDVLPAIEACRRHAPQRKAAAE